LSKTLLITPHTRKTPRQAILSDVLHIQSSVICFEVNYAVALSVKTQVDLVLLSSNPDNQ